MPMTREDELELFLDNLLSVAYTEYCQGAQHQLERRQLEQIEREMETLICADEKPVVLEWFEALLEIEGHKQSHAYRQGLQDMVFLLRSAGVLA